MKNFDKRLLLIFEKFSLNASSFADKIGVQRSSMSHILSGRNKPSLDFILKIYETFPEISLTWLALGEGDFFKTNNSNSTPNSLLFKEIENTKQKEENLNSIINYPKEEKTISDVFLQSENRFENTNHDISEMSSTKIQPSIENKDSEIEQILFFYKDGTFKSYRPK